MVEELLSQSKETKRLASQRCPVPIFTLTIGILTSAVSGYLAIDLLLRYLRTRTTYVFVWYRIGLGLALLALLAAGALQPLG